ncbi:MULTISPECIES: YetF domain-containing protein [unclassified Bacillus (in: firmicutes)]|uniref:YetF domain-containing protein n=1 Tax=unclassified Bacillus (in: firmicutes) TaxID=185979 RepID=UPI0035C9410C
MDNYTFNSDGEFITYNLKKFGLQEVWLQKELKKQRTELTEVCYAEWSKEGSLFIQKY